MRNFIVPLLAAVVLSAAGVPLARADQKQPATGTGTWDPSVPLHQPEMRSLANMGSDDGFVTQLLMMRGHLRVGRELYEAGVLKVGAEHSSHPLRELYQDLALQLENRDLPPFHAELRALGDAAQQGKPAAEIAGLFDRANAAIDAAIASIDKSTRTSAAFAARVAAALMRTAWQEYEISLTDGRIANVLEYQDSWAFYHQARAVIAAAHGPLAAKDSTALAELNAQLQALAPLWPSPDPAKLPVINLALVARTADRVDELRESFQ